MTIETDEPAGALVVTAAAVRTKRLLADLAPAALLLEKDPLAGASEFMRFRGLDLVAVTVGFFEYLGYHFKGSIFYVIKFNSR